ncbi:MAG: hypothetical protein Q9187_005253 [Circinaria calcarea]
MQGYHHDRLIYAKRTAATAAMPAKAMEAPKELADPVKGAIGELVGSGTDALEKYEHKKQFKHFGTIYPVPDAAPTPVEDGIPGATGAVTKVGAALEDSDGEAPMPTAPTVTVESMVVGTHVLIVMTEINGAEVAGRAALFDETDTATGEDVDGVSDGTTEGAAEVMLYDAADDSGTAATEVDSEAIGYEVATTAEELDDATEMTVYVDDAATDELAALVLTTGAAGDGHLLGCVASDFDCGAGRDGSDVWRLGLAVADLGDIGRCSGSTNKGGSNDE